MSAPIGPGDWVERLRTANGLVKGSLWRVAEVGPGWVDGLLPGCAVCQDPRSPGLRLVGDPFADHPKLWCSCGFRPIYRPNASLTADLLRRAKEPLRTEEEEKASRSHPYAEGPLPLLTANSMPNGRGQP